MILMIFMLAQQHGLFERMLGAWQTVQRVVSAEPLVETTGQAYGRLAFGGRFLFLESRGMSQGQPVRVTTIMGYDEHQKEFQAVAVGENATTIFTSSGHYDAANQELVLRGRMVDTRGDRPVRYVFRFESEERFVFEAHDTDAGGREFLVVETTHVRASLPIVRGIGGVFFKARDPQSLRAWYAEHLGIRPWNEDVFGSDSVVFEGSGYTVWGPFPESTRYFDPSEKPFMFNYRVDDLDGMLEKLRSGGVSVDDKVEEYPYGRFGWIMDPEGNRIELWEPPPTNR